MEKKTLYCCQYCGKNWEVIQQQLDEFDVRLRRVEDGMEVEVVSSDDKKRSTIAFRQMDL